MEDTDCDDDLHLQDTEYIYKLGECMTEYTTVNKSSFLSDEDQVFLRLWYRREKGLTTGWITYWVDLATHDPDLFITFFPRILNIKDASYKDINPWKDIATILKICLYKKNQECISVIAHLIQKQLTSDILANIDDSDVAQALPVNKKSGGVLYSFLLKFFNQTAKDWRQMIVGLRKEYLGELRIPKQIEQLSYYTCPGISGFFNYPYTTFFDMNNRNIKLSTSSNILYSILIESVNANFVKTGEFDTKEYNVLNYIKVISREIYVE